MSSSAGLQLVEVHKYFGEIRAVNGVSFAVHQGEIVASLGPSGCGKSTVLMVIAGLERPDRGDIMWNGRSLRNVPPHRREFGLMFQDYILFPHMDVSANIAFGLRMADMDSHDVKERVATMLELVGLQHFGDRDVHTLSGGEQQRVALARALAPAPRLLMLDEPFGSLDRTLRERLMVELRQILRRMNQTAVYVTHDQEEAFAIADRVVLMRAGQVEQQGTPQSIYRRPASLFVARFLGFTNLLPGLISQSDGRTFVETAIGQLPIDNQDGGAVTVLLRPDSVFIGNRGECQLTGKLVESSFRGSLCRATISVDGVLLSFDFPSSADLPAAGESIRVSFDPEEALQIFEE